jgi:hypothetical protein
VIPAVDMLSVFRVLRVIHVLRLISFISHDPALRGKPEATDLLEWLALGVIEFQAGSAAE